MAFILRGPETHFNAKRQNNNCYSNIKIGNPYAESVISQNKHIAFSIIY